MVDGVISIPLPGSLLKPDREECLEIVARSFLAGPENRLVEIAVRSVMSEPVNGYNPLVLYGPSGTGKSHIAHGLASLWKNQNRRHRVVIATAIDFARELNDAIESQAVEEFRTKYRTANLLVIEDLGRLVTKKSEKLNVQEELIHTLDVLLMDERWVVVTASVAPTELPNLLPPLQSRLTAGLVIPLAPPGPEARIAVLQQLASLRNIDLPESVARSLAEGLRGTVPELAGALTQLAAPVQFGAEPIDLQQAKEYITEQNNIQQPTLHEIALATARYFSLRLSDLRSPVRRRALVVARGVAFYLAKRFAKESFEEIGRYFGNRDHTTIMHSYHKTEERVTSDPTTHQAIERLHKELWKT
jgi:chromosomal replication initiator protein